MSRSRRRREQGHPARIAARRERERAQREPPSPFVAVCAEAATLEDPREVELMASELLGYVWDRRDPLALEADDDELSAAIVAEIKEIGGPGASLLLSAFAALAPEPELAERARAALEVLDSPPAWAASIGRGKFVAAAEMREEIFDDGRTYFIESERENGTRDVVGIYVDNNIGRSAKDILLADSIEQVRESLAHAPAEEVAEILLEPIDPATAGRRLRAALDQTDRTIDPLIEEDYVSLRAVAHARVAQLPGDDIDPDFDPIPDGEERAALIEELLASPEGEGIDPEGDAADVVRMAIDYGSDYSDGRPLRWSPVTVELFMADWLPRKVLAEDEYFDAVPDALSAWIRFAARKRGIPAAALDANLAAIEDNHQAMLDALAAPPGDNPTAELFAALKAADIDVSDERSLQTFIAGWNARSTLN